MGSIEMNVVSGADAEKFYEHCNKTQYPYGFATFGSGKCIMRKPEAGAPVPLQEILDFKTRASDIWILSFPKCGSTWLQEMVWLVGSNLDFEGAKKKLHLRVPFIGSTKGRYKAKITEPHHEMEGFNDIPKDTTRFIKSHLPYNLLPYDVPTVRPRLIYVVRDPIDTCESYFHFSKNCYRYTGTFEDFCEAFLTDNVPYAPFWNHVKSFWHVKEQSNVLILKFEDMKKDLRGVILRVAAFLGTEIKSEEDMQKALHHLSFESMKSNPATTFDDIAEKNKYIFDINGNKDTESFFRKGEVGSGKMCLSEEMKQKFDKWNTAHGIPEFSNTE